MLITEKKYYKAFNFRYLGQDIFCVQCLLRDKQRKWDNVIKVLEIPSPLMYMDVASEFCSDNLSLHWREKNRVPWEGFNCSMMWQSKDLKN